MRGDFFKRKVFFIATCFLSSLESVALSLSLYETARILEFAQAGQRGKYDLEDCHCDRLAFFGVFAPCRFHGCAIGLPFQCGSAPETGDHEKNVLLRPWRGFSGEIVRII